MTVKTVIRLWPENRVVICIEAVGAHDHFTFSNRRFGDEALIRGGDKIFSIKEERPDYAIRRTNFPCKDAFSGKTIINPRFNMPPSTRNLSKLSVVSTAVILIRSY